MNETKTAYVICLNDTIKYVIVDNRPRAEAKLAELRDAYAKQNPWVRGVLYWHIDEVSAE